VPAAHADVDAYLSDCPDAVRPVLQEIRRVIAEAAPGSGEKIAYGMPTATLDGKSLLHYGAWKKHVGVYPVPALPDPLEVEIAPYRTTTSTVNLPLAAPIPYDLLGRVVAAIVAGRAARDTSHPARPAPR